MKGCFVLLQQVKEEEDDEKLQLAQSCQLFKGWPVMSLKKISQTFNWFKVPAGESKTVLSLFIVSLEKLNLCSSAGLILTKCNKILASLLFEIQSNLSKQTTE